MSEPFDPVVERAAAIAADRARRLYYDELRQAEREFARSEAMAATIGAGRLGNHIASAVADAALAAPQWSEAAVADAIRRTLAPPPDWAADLAAAILAGYPVIPADRPRELASYVAQRYEFRAHLRGAPGAGDDADRYRVVNRTAVATRMMRRPFHTRPIDHLGQLASALGVAESDLAWLADRRGMNHRATDRRLRHYRYLWLNGRLIEAPKPRLRAIQRWLLVEVIGPIPAHPSAHGFVPGRSPFTYAATHCGQALVIRLDVTSFFAAVTAPRVYGMFRAAGYPEPVAHTLTALCTTRTPAAIRQTAPPSAPDRGYRLALLARPHLPQGAPTSPALANRCAYRLDRRLAGAATSFGARYSRYADDLAFSGQLNARGAAGLVELVTAIAADEGFRINQAKTRVRGQADRQLLAGLVVNRTPAVPRTEYDALRALLHNAARTGLAEQNRDGLADFRAHVLGRISWVGHHHPTRAAKLAALLAQVADVG
jgi:retron-type reverse transcriptase